MKGVAYKLKHIRWKFDVKQIITEDFKSKKQKPFISFDSVTTSLILQNFSNPLQQCHLFLLF